MVKMSKSKRVVIVSIVVLLLIASAIVSVCVYSDINNSYARTAGVEEESYTAQLADFDMDFSVTYTTGGNTVTLSSGDLNAQHGVIRLTKAEYDTLKLNAVYTGPGKCYYRFKLTESWMHTENIGGDNVDIITPKELSEYTFGTDIYDNRSDDGYIYSSVPLKDDNQNITVITNFTEGADAPDLVNPAHASQFVDMSIEFEAVQWNRAEELWGLSKLPWVN